MSEQILQGFVAAQDNNPAAVPMEATASTKGSCGLYIAFQYPNRNNDLDPTGLPQPIAPPMEIQYVETRFTFDDRAGVDWQDNYITWTYHQKVAPLGDSANIADPSQPFDPITNDYTGITSTVVLRPIMIKANIYFQMRTISRSGVPSDWTDIVKLSMNPTPVEPDSNNGLSSMPCHEDSVVFMPNNLI